jgi:hypothetical protein
MTPEERAATAYQEWISQLDDEARRAIAGTPYQQAFIEVVADAIANAQQTVALGAGTTELPHQP